MAHSQRGAPTSQNPGLAHPGFTPGSENQNSFGVQEVLQDIMRCWPAFKNARRRCLNRRPPAPCRRN